MEIFYSRWTVAVSAVLFVLMLLFLDIFPNQSTGLTYLHHHERVYKKNSKNTTTSTWPNMKSLCICHMSQNLGLFSFWDMKGVFFSAKRCHWDVFRSAVLISRIRAATHGHRWLGIRKPAIIVVSKPVSVPIRVDWSFWKKTFPGFFGLETKK